ncbi:MAG TPA: response regulator transcription factor [Nocardioidaceae bacterium]|jgi:DNA-binding NarL/FixJ family response regulator|nr:response regulator transcription factor [Nocardioidaceae bacterium]
MTIRLVLGEDNALLREGMRGLLSLSEDIEVVASCADLPTLRESVDALRPDVVLTDIRMPPSWTDEGVQIARHCRAHHPDTGVVLLSQYVDPGYVRSLLDSGSAGRGYLLKERVSDLDELVSAVTTVASGGSVVDPQVIEHLVKAGMSRGDRNVGRLSARELEVLAEMSRGHSNATIASTLFITQRAVEKHINSIFAKLGVAGSDGAHPRVRAVLLYLSGSVS